jgi:hypothetical protein
VSKVQRTSLSPPLRRPDSTSRSRPGCRNVEAARPWSTSTSTRAMTSTTTMREGTTSCCGAAEGQTSCSSDSLLRKRARGVGRTQRRRAQRQSRRHRPPSGVSGSRPLVAWTRVVEPGGRKLAASGLDDGPRAPSAWLRGQSLHRGARRRTRRPPQKQSVQRSPPLRIPPDHPPRSKSTTARCLLRVRTLEADGPNDAWMRDDRWPKLGDRWGPDRWCRRS